jgi:hypothetical protein
MTLHNTNPMCETSSTQYTCISQIISVYHLSNNAHFQLQITLAWILKEQWLNLFQRMQSPYLNNLCPCLNFPKHKQDPTASNKYKHFKLQRVIA